MADTSIDDPATHTTPARLTRVQQRDASRQRLLDAAFECIVELGYSGASTLVIAQRAGVSSGALFNHFPTKDDLLAATVKDLYERYIGDLNLQLLTEAAASQRPVPAIIDILWDALRSPTLQALYELFGAARTNPHLQQQLDDCQEEHAEALFAFTQLLFPEAAEWPGLRGVMGLTITSIQGGAIASLAFGRSFDLSHTKLALVNAVEQALAEAEAWSAAHAG